MFVMHAGAPIRGSQERIVGVGDQPEVPEIDPQMFVATT